MSASKVSADRDDPRSEPYLLEGETGGISGAVETLMMVPDERGELGIP